VKKPIKEDAIDEVNMNLFDKETEDNRPFTKPQRTNFVVEDFAPRFFHKMVVASPPRYILIAQP
jgi:hypothetical protein